MLNGSLRVTSSCCGLSAWRVLSLRNNYTCCRCHFLDVTATPSLPTLHQGRTAACLFHLPFWNLSHKQPWFHPAKTHEPVKTDEFCSMPVFSSQLFLSLFLFFFFFFFFLKVYFELISLILNSLTPNVHTTTAAPTTTKDHSSRAAKRVNEWRTELTGDWSLLFHIARVKGREGERENGRRERESKS